MKKKLNRISFRMVAYTDAAGKYSPDAARGGNEDNFYVSEDLTGAMTGKVGQDEILQLGSRGMLMVVADGMGGMNAGEVASQIAVDTVKSAFEAESLTDTVTATAESRRKYLEQVIRTADKNIKSAARKDWNCEGMGSTIIMAWLYDDELTVSWCGDSRAYIFNEKSGIRLISRDHSYVQELVNKGILTYDQTFDHPQNNIITRSLGDPGKDAKAESRTLNVGKGDIILLCSDGLSGVLRDRKTYDSNGNMYPEENLEDIIRQHGNSMKECREGLWEAAERGGWYDNVTAILCKITDGPESVWASASISDSPQTAKKSGLKNPDRRWIYALLGMLGIVALAGSFYLGRKSGESSKVNQALVDIDSVKSDSVGDADPKDPATNENAESEEQIQMSDQNETQSVKDKSVVEQIQEQSGKSEHTESGPGTVKNSELELLNESKRAEDNSPEPPGKDLSPIKREGQKAVKGGLPSLPDKSAAFDGQLKDNNIN